MKKLIIVLTLLGSTIFGYAQPYGKVELAAHFANSVKPAMFFSGGAFIKNRTTGKGTFNLGLGFGVIAVDANEKPYIPLFVETGYCNTLSKASLYVSGKVGWAIYNGNAAFIDKQVQTRGGLFANARVGVGLKTKWSTLAPFIGLAYIMLRNKSTIDHDDYYKAIVDAGIAVIIF